MNSDCIHFLTMQLGLITQPNYASCKTNIRFYFLIKIKVMTDTEKKMKLFWIINSKKVIEKMLKDIVMSNRDYVKIQLQLNNIEQLANEIKNDLIVKLNQQ